MAEIIDLFKTMILVSLFYSFAITVVAYALPAEDITYLSAFSDPVSDISFEGTTAQIQEGLTQQTNIPVIELGALVFYSGNILIDLLLNFAFAVPQMLGMIVNGIMLLFNIDSYIFAIIQAFGMVAVSALYFIGIIQLLTGIRSGRIV